MRTLGSPKESSFNMALPAPVPKGVESQTGAEGETGYSGSHEQGLGISLATQLVPGSGTGVLCWNSSTSLPDGCVTWRQYPSSLGQVLLVAIQAGVVQMEEARLLMGMSNNPTNLHPLISVI